MNTTIRGGEATLLETIFKSESLDEVVREATRRGLRLTELRDGRVTKDEPWKSTEESTDIVPAIYLDGPSGLIPYIIVKRPKDKEWSAPQKEDR